MRMNVTYQFEGEELTLTQIQTRFFPQRSQQWIKKGLLANAKTITEVVNAAEDRHREGLRRSRAAARTSQFSYKSFYYPRPNAVAAKTD